MRYAQQRAFSPKKWLDAKSEFFTRLCERTATHREVLRAHAAFGSIGFAAIAAETQLLLSLLFIIIAAYNVYRLNQYEQLANGHADGQTDGLANGQALEQKGGAL